MGIIVLAFIGTRQFISSKEDSPPTVEIVASTPTEDETSVAQTDAARKGAVITRLPEDKPQISAGEMQQIEDFFDYLEGADEQSETQASQLATDGASNQDSESGETESGVASEGTILSAEGVMNAYVQAHRDADFEAMLPFATGTVRESIESSLRILGGAYSPEELVNNALNSFEDVMPELMSEEAREEMREEMIRSLREARTTSQTPEGLARRMRESFNQIEIVSSGYIGDEFHFRLEAPPSDNPANTGLLLKMREVDGEWRIYDQEGMMSWN